MIVRLGPALILAAIATLVLCLLPSRGFFSDLAFAGAVGTLGLTMSALVLPGREWCIRGRWRSALPADSTGALLLLVTVVLTATAIFSTELTYQDFPEFNTWLVVVATAGCFVSAMIGAYRIRPLLYPSLERPVQQALPALTLVLAVALASRIIVLFVSPDPVIDVYTWLRDASGHVLHGRNPYSSDISTPYGTKRAIFYQVPEPPDPRPPAYPPLPFLLCLPLRALTLDVRWANIIGDLTASIALFGVAAHRGRPSLGLVSACLFSNLPRSMWIIEQAWYEPMLAGLFGLGFWLIEYGARRRWFGFILLSLALTGKQFGLPLLLPLAWSQRRHWRMLLTGLIVSGLLMLPWIIWSPHDFFDVILFKHLHRSPQLHSLTFGSACQEYFDWTPPKGLGWTLAALMIFVISWRTPENGAAAALGVGTALFVFCFFHTQGFPNYFYLCEYLWLLGMIGLLPIASGARAKPQDGHP